MNDTDFKCDNCGNDSMNILYEGWFKAVPTNCFNKGTADDGLIQFKRLCLKCVKLFDREKDIIKCSG